MVQHNLTIKRKIVVFYRFSILTILIRRGLEQTSNSKQLIETPLETSSKTWKKVPNRKTQHPITKQKIWSTSEIYNNRIPMQEIESIHKFKLNRIPYAKRIQQRQRRKLLPPNVNLAKEMFKLTLGKKVINPTTS
jgi:hypothetical protein